MASVTMMLSEHQQKNVWEGWLSSEMRANYFADLSGRYQRRQQYLTWLTLVFSSGAFGTLVTDWVPKGWAPVLALLTVCLSLASLVAQNQKKAFECSDLHFRWSRLASDYEALWDDMYSEEAVSRLRALDERGAELSRSGTALPYKENVMKKWQRHVERHHGVPAAA